LGQAGVIPARWRLPGLVACNLAALMLFASWRWPRTKLIWDGLDAAAFQLLNAPLAGNALWAQLWGVCNMRPVDLGFGLVMLAILIKGNFIFPATRVRQALYAFVAVLALLLLIRVGPLNELVKAMHWQRASPSLTVEGAVRLTVLFPDWVKTWHMKDSSGVSFPGDHASILLLWAIFLSSVARGWRLWVIWGLALLFMLPRLVSGAHWLSDVLVGGVFLALLAVGWGFCTPYAATASALMERLFAPVVRLLGKLPGLRRLSLFSSP